MAALRTHPLAPENPPPLVRSRSSDRSITPASAPDMLMDELQAHVAALALQLAPPDAALALTLAALLGCIERLLSITLPYRSPLLTQGTFPAPPSVDDASVYATLEREARALKESRDPLADELVGAARDVERAERDLLWGRVDDLAERVGALCRDRAAAEAESPVEDDVDEDDGPMDEEKRLQWVRERESEHPEHPVLLPPDAHDLPRYSTDHASHPPAYAAPASPTWEEKPPLSPTPRARQPSSDKRARDLESVSAAIERLYRVSPQLANQRVEPDRVRVRERQLATLGNAIERLSRGRLDDQRAAPSAEDAPLKAARLQRQQDLQLDRLIEQIDKAASRTLTDQRVDVNAFTGRRGKERATTRLVRPPSSPIFPASPTDTPHGAAHFGPRRSPAPRVHPRAHGQGAPRSARRDLQLGPRRALPTAAFAWRACHHHRVLPDRSRPPAEPIRFVPAPPPPDRHAPRHHCDVASQEVEHASTRERVSKGQPGHESLE